MRLEGWTKALGLLALLATLGCAQACEGGSAGADAHDAEVGTPDVSEADADAVADTADGLVDTAADSDAAPGPDAGDAADDDGAVGPDVGQDGTADVCAPDCDGRVCGGDGCGGSCGSCEAGQLCTVEGACLAPVCTPGTVSCVGDALAECVDASKSPVILTSCALGCVPGEGGAACEATCAAGEDISCDAGVALTCAASGDAAHATKCLGGCLFSVCDGVGETERELPTGEGDEDEVWRFGVAAEGQTMLFAWSRVLAPGLRVMRTDGSGNVQWGPAELPGSDAVTASQLQVAAAPGGGFFVMALQPDVEAGAAALTLWRVGTGPAPTMELLTEDLNRSLPSLVALGEQAAVYHLAAAAGGEGEVLARTSWLASGAMGTVEVVDAGEVERFDVAAVRVGAAEAHVYASFDGGMRLSTSSLESPGGASKGVGEGDYLIASLSGASARSVALALRLTEAGEDFAYRVEGGTSAGEWQVVGSLDEVDWAQAALTGADGVVVVRQSLAGAMSVAWGTGGGLQAPVDLGIPEAGGTRSDFRLVGTELVDPPRLVTLGRINPDAPARLRIRALVP